MRTELFDFELPNELIAQEPIEPRDRARLMVVHRSSGKIEHRRFYELVEVLNEGDVLVVNDTKVIKARLYGQRLPTGGKVEVLLLREIGDGVWEVLVRPSRKARPNTELKFGEEFIARVVEVKSTGTRVIQFNLGGDEFWKALNNYGRVPTPPYIKGEVNERDYQTVYASKPGAVAAPTAGLHFTESLINALIEAGIKMVAVTLHVGWATFKPITSEEVEQHEMEEEYCEVTEDAARTVNEAKDSKCKVIAVGTTSVRTLETVGDDTGHIKPWVGWTNLYITPGYRFKVVDALITNFHTPRSTNLVLVASFAGLELTRYAYQIAIRERYRFYSFGDAMLILP
ncbi:MAG: tRNA preQ1(34) S-adenosylmethionine ribosyltransferase-isomerase QueA [Armatimonadota bacterium]|nr:tRNA preQ1(34) S-adenosylmethionine ribosyltransferase-isomerase QueA [Armatimonadota bacterium]MCX7776566.1 tRNA preQ1(34) S-adenosylmethionine ribosyltransferase-isomerase QueA [Armatimonadota bacterium]MDW8026100.1 tRNA preQ1(34) S-adenosylmethionine ribosyltransferase-isomerase QueA [Armatimonadota bacterium]